MAETIRGTREARLEQALRDVLAEVVRHMKLGKQVTYPTASEPMGVRGGVRITRVGDLCDVRDAVERIVDRALLSEREEAEGGAEPGRFWWHCEECDALLGLPHHDGCSAGPDPLYSATARQHEIVRAASPIPKEARADA